MNLNHTAFESASRSAADSLKDDLLRYGPKIFTASEYRRGIVRHIVLLCFANTVSEVQQNALVQAFLDLREDCRRDGKPYIRSIEHGLQSSGEGAHGAFEHAFLLSFDSEGDRNYYVGEPVVTDPAYYDSRHHAFKALIGPLLAPQGVLVFDYTL
ncbi:Dabb family protein [Paraburkholderia sp. J12]|uniref:Dabb family protein n=1 Tax=Paraburkholderia sp. J12 TaxID=2805432 RepID=UPI002ABDC90C|nr:Dabb family protein [Paraburkholderia sp. J12]